MLLAEHLETSLGQAGKEEAWLHPRGLGAQSQQSRRPARQRKPGQQAQVGRAAPLWTHERLSCSGPPSGAGLLRHRPCPYLGKATLPGDSVWPVFRAKQEAVGVPWGQPNL